MTFRSALLQAALILADGTAASASVTSPIVSSPHKYFTKKIRQSVDEADTISPEARPYVAKYPSINISSWIDPTSSTGEERQDVVYQVLEQAIGAGSFNIIGHNVTAEFLDHLETSTEKFFSQSIDFKRKFTTGDAKSGYKGNMEEKYGATVFKTDNPYEQKGDIREIFGVVDGSPDNVQGPEYFQSSLNEYIEQLQPIELALTKIFSAALSLAKGVDLPVTYLHEADEGSTGNLRAIRYPDMPSEYDDATRLLPHSDVGSLTIIYGSEKGLEEIRDGRWVEVPINKDKGELHVTIGEVYTMWSNELFSNNIHRVSKQAAKDRVSFAYFIGQGQKAAGEGIQPVCAKDEVARFPRSSSAIHLDEIIAAMLSGESR